MKTAMSISANTGNARKLTAHGKNKMTSTSKITKSIATM